MIIIRYVFKLPFRNKCQFMVFKLQAGSTPLHLACQANEVDTVEMLINKGADLNCLNNVSKASNIQLLLPLVLHYS